MVGNLTDFSFDERGNLVITLTDEGREEALDMREQHPDWGDIEIFVELIESYLCNGWELLHVEELGELMSDDALILSQDAMRNDDGDLLSVENIYFFHDYQLQSEVDVMLSDGLVVLGKE